MITQKHSFQTLLVGLAAMLMGCVTVGENPKKNVQLGLITTPPAYYTTQKARYLGEKYKNNLDRLVERIVRNPKTANLQFANNIASVGGIGFFTHSAASAADERFLEVILGLPETFDNKTDQNSKVHRVFSLYGTELLSILTSDSDIYQEREVDGYGLNLSWRNLVPETAGTRISLERTILYFPKVRARSFLRGELNQNSFLGEAVIFAVVDDGPMKLVSYRPQESKPDLRRPIQEEPLITEATPVKLDVQPEKAVSHSPPKQPRVQEQKSSAPLLPQPDEKIAELKVPHALTEKAGDRGDTILATNQETKVPAALLTSNEPVQPKKIASPIPIPEEILTAEQEAVDRASLTAREESNPEETSAIVDLASLPAVPVIAPAKEASNLAVSLKEPLKEPPLFERQQAKAAPVEQPVAPPVLQGFVIQLTFGEMQAARHWAETLEQRGFAVSLTEAGGGETVRVRIGNFTTRDEAERQLQALRREGHKGMVLNFPQAYRPGADPAIAEKRENTLSAAQ
jgi:hypothetical protein